MNILAQKSLEGTFNCFLGKNSYKWNHQDKGMNSFKGLGALCQTAWQEACEFQSWRHMSTLAAHRHLYCVPSLTKTIHTKTIDGKKKKSYLFWMCLCRMTVELTLSHLLPFLSLYTNEFIPFTHFPTGKFNPNTSSSYWLLVLFRWEGICKKCCRHLFLSLSSDCWFCLAFFFSFGILKFLSPLMN